MDLLIFKTGFFLSYAICLNIGLFSDYGKKPLHTEIAIIGKDWLLCYIL